MSATAAPVMEQSVVYMTQPGVQYVQQPQAIQYVQQPQTVQYMTQPAPQYVYADQGAEQSQLVYMEDGNVGYAPQYAQPTTYNISPERFAQLTQGHSLTQEEINIMLGGQRVEAIQPAAAPVAAAAPAVAPVSSKGAKVKSAKKKAKGCC